MEFDVIVDIPPGSRNRYEMGYELHRVRLDRLTFILTKCPVDYGCVESTRGGDGDFLGPRDGVGIEAPRTW
jgi:inorganic pyrophosphatase